MSFEYWYMLPVAIMVATIAMASGVGGATFFSPIFLLALRLPTEVAIGAGLITEVFGFASGLYAYTRKGLIDFALGRSLLLATIPMALLGVLAGNFVGGTILKVILGAGLFAIALSFLRTPDHEDVELLDSYIENTYGGEQAKTTLVTAEGEEIRYRVCSRVTGRISAGVGGFFVGLISTGLGELNGYFLLQRCRVPSKVAVATSVFVVAITASVAASGHLVKFVQSGEEVLLQVLSICIFTAPGAVIGAILGSMVASRIPQKVLEHSLGILFILIAALTIGEVVLE